VDFASFLLCALKARWQGFGAVSCKFFRKDVARKIPKPQTLHPKNPIPIFARKSQQFLAIFSQEVFLGQFLAIFFVSTTG
jgi:hypothetical protein